MAAVSETQVSRRGEAERVQYESACERIWWAGLFPHSLSLLFSFLLGWVGLKVSILLRCDFDFGRVLLGVEWSLGKNVRHCGVGVYNDCDCVFALLRDLSCCLLGEHLILLGSATGSVEGR